MLQFYVRRSKERATTCTPVVACSIRKPTSAHASQKPPKYELILEETFEMPGSIKHSRNAHKQVPSGRRGILLCVGAHRGRMYTRNASLVSSQPPCALSSWSWRLLAVLFRWFSTRLLACFLPCIHWLKQTVQEQHRCVGGSGCCLRKAKA